MRQHNKVTLIITSKIVICYFKKQMLRINNCVFNIRNNNVNRNVLHFFFPISARNFKGIHFNSY